MKETKHWECPKCGRKLMGFTKGMSPPLCGGHWGGGDHKPCLMFAKTIKKDKPA